MDHIELLQNHQSEWTALMKDEAGNTIDYAPLRWSTRAEGIAWCRANHPGVHVISEGVTLGVAAPPAPLPVVDARAEAERAGVAAGWDFSGAAS